MDQISSSYCGKKFRWLSWRQFKRGIEAWLLMTPGRDVKPTEETPREYGPRKLTRVIMHKCLKTESRSPSSEFHSQGKMCKWKGGVLVSPERSCSPGSSAPDFLRSWLLLEAGRSAGLQAGMLSALRAPWLSITSAVSSREGTVDRSSFLQKGTPAMGFLAQRHYGNRNGWLTALLLVHVILISKCILIRACPVKGTERGLDWKRLCGTQPFSLILTVYIRRAFLKESQRVLFFFLKHQFTTWIV